MFRFALYRCSQSLVSTLRFFVITDDGESENVASTSMEPKSASTDVVGSTLGNLDTEDIRINRPGDNKPLRLRTIHDLYPEDFKTMAEGFNRITDDLVRIILSKNERSSRRYLSDVISIQSPEHAIREVPADAPSLTTPVSTDFFESLCVPGSASTNSEPSTGSIYCYTSRCTKGLALDKYGSTKTCKDLILQLRLYNGKKMCSDGSNQYWNFKETDCLYTMSQNSVIAGLAKQLIDEVNQHLNESGATLKKSSKRYRPY
uniref:Nonstructural protein n=1 Tax=Planococcus citri densovirus TaxID=159153 RepID=A0A218L3M5_9VIRU|nr:nonstructural protein [Planococcus citri densovirus]